LKDAEAIKTKLAELTDFTQRTTLLDELAHRMIMPYLVLAIFLAALAIMIRLAHLPEINPEEDEANDSIQHTHKSIFQYRHLWLGVMLCFFMWGLK